MRALDGVKARAQSGFQPFLRFPQGDPKGDPAEKNFFSPISPNFHMYLSYVRHSRTRYPAPDGAGHTESRETRLSLITSDIRYHSLFHIAVLALHAQFPATFLPVCASSGQHTFEQEPCEPSSQNPAKDTHIYPAPYP